jgi:hypothetical protein
MKATISQTVDTLPLLRYFLSAMPVDTRREQHERFRAVRADFEFGTWIDVSRVNALVQESAGRGYAVWCNADATSAFLYGAKSVSDDDLAGEVLWISKNTLPSMEGTALRRRPGSEDQLLQISHMNFASDHELPMSDGQHNDAELDIEVDVDVEDEGQMPVETKPTTVGVLSTEQRMKLKLELGAAFVWHIQETMQSVAAGSHGLPRADLPKAVAIQTRGFQLQSTALRVMKQAAEIVLDGTLSGAANSHGVSKDQLMDTLWPETNTIVCTVSRVPPNGYVWELDLNE